MSSKIKNKKSALKTRSNLSRYGLTQSSRTRKDESQPGPLLEHMAASPDFDEEARAIFKKLNLLKDGGELIGDVEKERLRYVQGEGKKISMQIYIYIYIYSTFS
jgi:hypothetical protein